MAEEEQKAGSGLGSGDRSRQVLLGVMALYALALVVLIATGTFVFFPKEVVLPALLIPPALSGRAFEFLNDWLIFTALVVLFDAFRGLAYSVTTFLDLPVYMQYVIGLEEALLGGDVLPVILQRNLLGDIGFLEKALVVVHASHFVVLFAFGMVMWYWRRDRWPHFRRSLLMVIYLGLLGYLLVPTVPPWMAANFFETLPPIRKVAGEIYNASAPQLAAGFDTNPIAAMPSLHTAIPILMSLVAVREFRWRAAPIVIYTALVLFGITYMGEHYLLDVMAGVLLAVAVYVVVFYRLQPRTRDQLAAKSKASLSPFEVLKQRVALAAAIFVMTFFIARASTDLQTGWAPTESFIKSDIVGHSPLGNDFLVRRYLEDQKLEKAQDVLLGIPMIEQTEATLTLASSAFKEQPSEMRSFADRYLAARPNSAERVFTRVVVLSRDGLISKKEVLEAAQWLRAQEDPRAHAWAGELLRPFNLR